MRDVPSMLRALLTQADAADPALQRLFPPAYVDDPGGAAEFERMVRGDLVAQRLAALDTMERTIEADRLSEDEIVAWMAAINDLRLVLGVRLGVTEQSGAEDFEGDQERTRTYAVYAYLSWLEDDVVRAVSGISLG